MKNVEIFYFHFMNHYFRDKEGLMTAQNPLIQSYNKTELNNKLNNLNYNEGIKVLNSYVRERE